MKTPIKYQLTISVGESQTNNVILSIFEHKNWLTNGFFCNGKTK